MQQEDSHVQLTPEDLARIAKGHTPLADWPDHPGDADLLHAIAFIPEPAKEGAD